MGLISLAVTSRPRAREMNAGWRMLQAWSKIPFNRGAWAEWTRDGRQQAYALLLEPDGPFYFAGEHMSWIPGWQEGAVLSAHEAIVEIAKRVRK
jgi:monoamine oxidase